MTAEPWQTGEIPGPKKAMALTKPDVVVAMVKKAKSPVMIVGHEVAEIEVEGEKLIDYVIRLAKVTNASVIATAHTVNELLRRGFKPSGFMSAVDVGNRLKDPAWKGPDGKGPYDLALFIGLPYYMEWTILSGLKHFAPDLKIVTLDREYQPHASWSIPNLPRDDWVKFIKDLCLKLA